MSILGKVWVAFALVGLASTASANEWVIGNVSIVEDYRAYDGNHGLLITLANKSYYGSGTAQTVCTERFRVVVGQEGVTADLQKVIFTTVLAARASGDKVRLFMNPSNVYANGYCAVQIASIGDI